MKPHGGRHLFIRRWGKIVTHNSLRCDNSLLVQAPTDQDLFGLPDTYRRIADSKKNDADILDQVIFELCENTGTDKSEVATAAREFMKSPAMSGVDYRDMDCDQQFTRLYSRLEEIDEEVIGGYATSPVAVCDFEFRAHCQRHRRKFGCRI